MVQLHDSSFVRGTGYDWDNGTLTLKLHNRTYEYYDVPEEVFQRLERAASFGKEFHRSIKGQYDYQQVTSPHNPYMDGREAFYEGVSRSVGHSRPRRDRTAWLTGWDDSEREVE